MFTILTQRICRSQKLGCIDNIYRISLIINKHVYLQTNELVRGKSFKLAFPNSIDSDQPVHQPEHILCFIKNINKLTESDGELV